MGVAGHGAERLAVAMASAAIFCLLAVQSASIAEESLPARMTLAAQRVPVGEKIVVRLSLPSDRRYGGGQFSAFVGLYLPADGINDWKAAADFGWDGLSGTQVLELVPPARLPPGRYEVRLNSERFAPAAQISLPVALYFARAPDALVVEKSAFSPGETIGIGLRLPKNRAMLGATPRAVLLPEGFANATTDALGTFWYSEGALSVDGTRRFTFERALPPGRYEIQLYYDRGNDYLLDSHRLVVASTPAQAAALNRPAAEFPAEPVEILTGKSQEEIVREGEGTESTVWTHELTTEGGTRIAAEDSNGGFAEAFLLRDGSISILAETPEGDVATIERDAAGDTLWIGDGEGDLLEARFTPGAAGTSPDRIAVKSLPDGGVAEIDAAGTLTYSDSFGAVTRIDTSGDGATVTTHTDDEGNHVIVRRDASGKVLGVESHRLRGSEPGREYYEQVVGGTEWESLYPLEKAKFANLEASERARVDLEHLFALRREAQEQADRAERAQKEAREAERDREFRRQQQEFAAAEAAREKAEAEIRRREARQQQLADSYAEAERLEREYLDAQARGDVAGMARAQARQDRHAEASAEILRFTEEEEAAMQRDSQLRRDLGERINLLTENAAAGELAEAATSGEAVARIADSTIVSLGAGFSAEFRRKVHDRDRAAEDEEIRARNRLAVIDQLARDPALNDREREILGQQRLLASGKLTGATTLRDRTAALQAVAGAADAVQLFTGGYVANGVLKAVRGAKALGQASGGIAAAIAPQTAETASAVSTSVARVAGGGARVVASATADAARAFGDTSVKVAEELFGKQAVTLASDIASGAGTAAKATAEVAFTDVGEAAQALKMRLSQRASAGLGDAVADVGRVETQVVKMHGEIAGPGAGGAAPMDVGLPPVRPPAPLDQKAFVAARERARAQLTEAEQAVQRLRAEGRSISEADVHVMAGRVIHDMQAGALEDLVREARAVGLSETRIGGAVGDPAYLAPGYYGRALERLEREILAHQGVEIVESLDSAQAVRRLAVRARTGAIQRSDITSLREIMEAAARQGEEPFARLARQGSFPEQGGFQPLLYEADIAALRKVADDHGITPAVERIRATAAARPATQRLAREEIEAAMRDAGAADTRILSRAELERPAAGSRPRRRAGSGQSGTRPDLAGPDAPTVVQSGDPIIDAPRPAKISGPRVPPDTAGPDEPTTILRESQEAPARKPLVAEELTAEDLARWGDETGTAHQRPPPLRPIDRDAEYADEVGRVLSRMEARRPAEMAAMAAGDAALLQRQQQAGEFDFSRLQKPVRGKQLALQGGSVPRRRLVVGDSEYLRNIMGIRFVATQNEVDPRLINKYVQAMLNGEFPAIYQNGRPVKVSWNEDRFIQDGHHRIIAATIVAKLTGRPTHDLPNAVIPDGLWEIVEKGTNRVDKPWSSVAVQHFDRRGTVEFNEN